MEPQSISPRSHFERLPCELVRAILSDLSDLTSLRCAILSCRVLLNSFTAESSTIATQVLFNELDVHHVRPLAIAALHASKMVKPSKSSVQEFCSVHLQNRDTNAERDIRRLTLDQVTHLSRLHSTVSRLADDFTTRAFQALATSFKANEHRTSQAQLQFLTPSKVELHRIMRTLYVLEIFFSVFRQTAIPATELGQSMNDFLLRFSHWETEQMACMQELLFSQASSSFNEMAAHDVVWGRFRVAPAWWSGHLRLQTVYFMGIVALEDLAKARTYNERHELFDNGQIPRIRPFNLYRVLREAEYEGEGNEGVSFSDFEDAQSYALKVKRPYFDDPDDGPFRIWKWAQQSTPSTASVNLKRQFKLRQWGYVMWDRSRLDALDIGRFLWPPPPSEVTPSRLPPPADQARGSDASWNFSWRERSRIYCENGRGWWAAGDESKIIWRREEGISSGRGSP